MVKLLLITPLLAVLCHSAAFAQRTIEQDKHLGKQRDFSGITGDELQVPVLYPQPLLQQPKAVNEVVIGQTYFDLQTNASVQNRNIDFEDGTYGAAFIAGMSNPNFADRGSGYNYSGGANWGPAATSRIESAKAGWPSLLYTAGGTEVVVSHTGVANFTVNRRSTKGSGAWTETTIPTNTGTRLLWARAAVGGANGNTIHCIGITAPVFNNGTKYMGIDGALLYYRSTDEGATWDIVDYLIPALDSTHFNRTRSDSYAIVADGNTVAIAVFNQMADVIMLKSTDNGTTWNSQIVNDFPIDLWVVDQGTDINNDMIDDTLETSDESGAILIDHQGMVHMTFGHMRVRDNIHNDNQWTFFPLTAELYYWNESMGTGNFTVLATPEDADNDGYINYTGDLAEYKTALCSQSTLGQNADGTLFVCYSGHREDRYDATQNYRHIYAMKSNDNGVTWSQPKNLTPDVLETGYEAVFPCIAPVVTDRVRITYMRDLEPGLAVSGDLDPYALNEIMYLESDTSLVSTASLPTISGDIDVALFPNPASGSTTLKVHSKVNDEFVIELIDLRGNVLRSYLSQSIESGSIELSIDLTGIPSGSYMIRLSNDIGVMRKNLVVVH